MSAALSLVDDTPSDMGAEQALLGILIYDNAGFHEIEHVEPADFREPFHSRLFAAVADLIGKGTLAEVVGLGELFEADHALKELGGLRYLVDLVDHAPAVSQANHFARLVRESAQRRAIITLAAEMAQAAKTPGCDAQEVIGLAEAGLLAMQVSTRRHEPVTAGFAAGRVLDWLDAPEEAHTGVRTGIEPLDEALGPLQPGNVVALAGRTSMGKSAGAEVIAYNIAEQGRGVIQISTEMSEEEMARRHLTDIAHRQWASQAPEYRDILRRRISTDQRRMLAYAKDRLDASPLVMIRRSGVKLSMVRSICRRQAAVWARQGIALGAVFIDHMGHVRLDQPSRDRYADQTAISNATKELADELACPVFPLLQINRETEKRDDKRPGLSDIRDSGAWEQDADIVIGWYREAYYAQRQAEPKMGAPGSKEDAIWAEWDRARRSQTIEAIVLKARAGPPMTVKLWGDVARNAIRGSAPEGVLI